MITFKQFLSESRYAPLYHGTTIAKLEQILYSNTLKIGNAYGKGHFLTRDKEGRQISFTRSLDFAKRWGAPSALGRVAIEINTDKLKQRYKVTPFNFFGSKDNWHQPRARANAPTNKNEVDFYNQREEIVDKDIRDIDDYITKIWIWGLKDKEDLINSYPEVGNHPFLYDGDKKRWINK